MRCTTPSRRRRRPRPTSYPGDRDAATACPTPGHAFAIVGYTERGFVVHNSWGERVGRRRLRDPAVRGLAPERDGLLGRAARRRHRRAHGRRRRRDAARRRAARSACSSRAIRNWRRTRSRRSSSTWTPKGSSAARGRFRTNADDLALLVDEHLPRACERWGCADGVDVAIVVHDGLAGEQGALDRALHWIPLLYSATRSSRCS